MCNKLVIFQGGLCAHCNVWSVQKQQYYECRDPTNTRVWIKPDWQCQWPDGHPSGWDSDDRELYDVGNGQNCLARLCIRCESEDAWLCFIEDAAIDDECPQAFRDKIEQAAPEDLNQDDGQNRWVIRPYNPEVEEERLDFETVDWVDPHGMQRSIRQLEGPMKYWQHKKAIVQGEQTRLGIWDFDVAEELIAQFNSECPYPDDRRFRDIYDSGEWEGHPEQPYGDPGFYVEPENGEGTHESPESFDDHESYMNLDAPSGHMAPPEPAPPERCGMDNFLDGADYEDYSIRNL